MQMWSTRWAGGVMGVRPKPMRRRQVPRALGALTVAALTASLVVGCSSTKVASSRDSSSGTQGSQSAGPLSEISGTWTSIGATTAKFCLVRQSIGSTDAPTTTLKPGECVFQVQWGNIDRLEIDGGGRLTMSLSYVSQGRSGRTLDGSCSTTAKIDGRMLGLDGTVCQPAKDDTSNLDGSQLESPSWKLDGACLNIGDSWFEKTSGECSDHATAEQRFSSVGNEIENAS